ncbi:MAG: DUF3592 domain-containing protein [Nostoc sp. DedQUE12b]|uniref:DUF3592 domain-containing protein n=1 Tax=Nostoc sp. DedQUE12b TaxID=3075398 RepID=UPI002AD39EA3|nr:DUF3592 domain-containing protein [Nostoc sp. DedQUE12b]MDZ8089838.1 DUF3592 domain-containing protein [Nostoc sp. DedQUE12b]
MSRLQIIFFRITLLVSAAIFIGLAAFFGVMLITITGLSTWSTLTQPRIQWESTSATVVRRETFTFTKSEAEGKKLSCPVIQFTVQGQQYEKQSEPCVVKRRPCQDSRRHKCPRDAQFDRGQIVKVWYDRTNPRNTFIGNTAPPQSSFGDAIKIFSSLIVPIGVLLVVAKVMLDATKRLNTFRLRGKGERERV